MEWLLPSTALGDPPAGEVGRHVRTEAPHILPQEILKMGAQIER